MARLPLTLIIVFRREASPRVHAISIAFDSKA